MNKFDVIDPQALERNLETMFDSVIDICGGPDGLDGMGSSAELCPLCVANLIAESFEQSPGHPHMAAVRVFVILTVRARARCH